MGGDPGRGGRARRIAQQPRGVAVRAPAAPPSFQFYDERPDVFPGGRPARVAWGFLKLLRTKDQKPNFGRLQVQLYKWEEKASSALGALTRGPSSGATREFPGGRRRRLGRARRLRRVQVRDQDFRRAARAVPRAHQRDGILVASRRRGHRAPLGVRAMPKPLLLAGSAGGLSGGVKDDDDTFESRRPSRRERIERERTLGGGWRTAEARLARAPLEDLEEVADKLGRLPYETLCYGMNPRAAAARRARRLPAGRRSSPPEARSNPRSSSCRTRARAWTTARFRTATGARNRRFPRRRGRPRRL